MVDVLKIALQLTTVEILALAAILAVAAILRMIRQSAERRLATRFGWVSVFWTSWLGTPIHELSHLLMCLIFGHKVRKVALFQPNRQTGRLGYVSYSLRLDNPYQVLGAFFVGMAPVIGGCLALLGLFWVFFPQAAALSLAPSETMAVESNFVSGFFQRTWSLTKEVVTVENLANWKFWVFLYLAMCISSHLAPSGSDYRCSLRGLRLVLFGLILFNLLCGIAGGAPTHLASAFEHVMSSTLSLLGLSGVLCSVGVVVVFVATVPLKVRFQVSRRER